MTRWGLLLPDAGEHATALAEVLAPPAACYEDLGDPARIPADVAAVLLDRAVDADEARTDVWLGHSDIVASEVARRPDVADVLARLRRPLPARAAAAVLERTRDADVGRKMISLAPDMAGLALANPQLADVWESAARVVTSWTDRPGGRRLRFEPSAVVHVTLVADEDLLVRCAPLFPAIGGVAAGFSTPTLFQRMVYALEAHHGRGHPPLVEDLDQWRQVRDQPGGLLLPDPASPVPLEGAHLVQLLTTGAPVAHLPLATLDPEALAYALAGPNSYVDPDVAEQLALTCGNLDAAAVWQLIRASEGAGPAILETIARQHGRKRLAVLLDEIARLDGRDRVAALQDARRWVRSGQRADLIGGLRLSSISTLPSPIEDLVLDHVRRELPEAECWPLLTVLSEGWSGTLDELIDAARKLTSTG